MIDAKTGEVIEMQMSRLTQEACKSLRQHIKPPTENVRRLKQSLSDGWQYRITNEPGIYEASLDGVTWKRV